MVFQKNPLQFCNWQYKLLVVILIKPLQISTCNYLLTSELLQALFVEYPVMRIPVEQIERLHKLSGADFFFLGLTYHCNFLYT